MRILLASPLARVRKLRWPRFRIGRVALIYLAIEFLDEFVFGAREAAWPQIRTDLGLSYAQVGLVLSVPIFLANLIEPLLGILGDIWRRKFLVIGGGLAFAASLVALSVAGSFEVLLVATMALAPASGAFVSLSQASLMDSAPALRERNMVLWTFAGYVGALAATAVIAGLLGTGLSWRLAFAASAGMTGIMLAFALRARFQYVIRDTPVVTKPIGHQFATAVRDLFRAVRTRRMASKLFLLEISDLMLDVFLGFLALYMADVAGASPTIAVASVALWIGAGTLGSVLSVPLLARTGGVTYLKASAALAVVLFVTFLLVPSLGVRLVLIAALGLVKAGWYPVLQARVYDEVPERSGSVITMTNISGLFGSMMAAGIGLAASSWGLANAMWLLLFAPASILLFLWRAHGTRGSATP